MFWNYLYLSYNFIASFTIYRFTYNIGKIVTFGADFQERTWCDSIYLKVYY